MRKAVDRKHLRIAFYRTDPGSDSIVINTLVEHFGHIYVFDEQAELLELLKEETPKVLLITGDSVSDCLTLFYTATGEVGRKHLCNHRLVILVPKKDEAEAYDVFRNGLTDDYLVARPVYELHRSIVICEHLLFEMGVPSTIQRTPDWKNATLASFSEELTDLLKQFHEHRQDFEQLADQKLENINAALAGAAKKIDDDQAVELDLQALTQTLATISEKEVRPEVVQLRLKALSIIDSLTQSVEQVTQDNAKIEKDGEGETFEQDIQKVGPEIDAEEIRVLIVDDDAISGQVSAKTIIEQGFKVDVAHTGRHAFELLQHHIYSLALLDINLPDTNCFYVIDMIRKGNSENRGIPYVVLTSAKSKKLVRTAVEYGAGGYMLKPLSIGKFKKVCNKYGLK